MKNFLKNKKGETLVETLAAILIFTMASIILYSMVTTAANINRAARDKDDAIAAQMKVAEEQITKIGDGTVTMTFNGDSICENTPIAIFRNEDVGGLYSYFKAASAEEGTEP